VQLASEDRTARDCEEDLGGSVCVVFWVSTCFVELRESACCVVGCFFGGVASG